VFPALLTLSLAGLTPSGSGAATLSRWVQYGADNTVLLRAITDTPACPAMSVDGVTVPDVSGAGNDRATGVARRLTPATATAALAAAFPVTMCEAQLPLGGHTATIDGVPLKLPVADPRRIVVIGDTGCRVAGPKIFQACNDPSPAGFPLPGLSRMVAAMNPDMIIHVGDYYYRETPCNEAIQPGCAGTPYGDAWPAWNADFFSPAQPLLLAAPLALSRGNHESCGRGAQGWFSFLDVHPYDPRAVGCAFGSPWDYPSKTAEGPGFPSYLIAAGPISLLMLDSSFANTGSPASLVPSSFSKVESMTAESYIPDLTRQLDALGGKPAIMVTHRPAYGLFTQKGEGAGQHYIGGTPDEEAMFATGVPAPIRLLLSGHIHTFQALEFEGDSYAPQLVVGMGGTMLDHLSIPGQADSGAFPVEGNAAATIARMRNIGEFGFAVMDEAPGGYAIDLYFLNGVPHGHCVLQTVAARTLTCSE
jgi:hypothetical protein